MSLDTCHLFNLTRLYIYIYIFKFCVYLYVKAKFSKWSDSVGRCQVPLLSSLNSTHSNRVADGPLIQLNPTCVYFVYIYV